MRSTTTARHIGGVSYLLKIGFYTYSQRKEHMVNDIKACRKRRVLDQTVGHEYENKSGIFQCKSSPLANAAYQLTDLFCKKPIEGVIDQEEQSDLRHGITELLNHQESREYNKYLTPCSRQKSEQIVEPITFPQYYRFVLL